MRNIRVCVDAVPLLLRSAGVKTYVYHWARALRRSANGGSVDLFPFFSEPGECVHERSVVGPLRTWGGLALLHLSNAAPVLQSLGARYGIFHASHQLLRPPSNTPVTATLYDMTCWLTPEAHMPANVRGAKRFADLVMRRAAGLIAISENSRSDAVRILGLDQARIRVIYPGVDEAFFAARPAVGSKPYLLFVGTIEPRKNVGVLLDAYTLLPKSLRDAYDLVVAGSPGWGDPAVLARLQSDIPGVHYLGYVAEDALPPLTAGAALFVYPSLYEGFGLPVAQAMASGVAVVTSNTSSLPEVAAEGGLLVDPRSPAELAAAIERVLTSPSLGSDLARKGRERAQLYRWDRAAKESWKFFEEIAG